MSEIKDKIEQVAADGIQEVTSDAGTVKQVPIPDLIEAAKFMAANSPTRRRRRIRSTKIIPPEAG